MKGLDLELGEELEEWIYSVRELIASRVREAYLVIAKTSVSQKQYFEAALLVETAYFLVGAPEPSADQLKLIHTILLAAEHPKTLEVEKEANYFRLSLCSSAEEARVVLQTDYGNAKSRESSNLPIVSGSFEGREEEFKELEKLLRDKVGLITLLGPGGMGKTRFSLELGNSLGRHFPDGVFFAELEALVDPQQIPLAIAEALNMQLFGSNPVIEQVLHYIGSKTCLLIVDNFEHVLEGVPFIKNLMTRCPNLVILATSRVVLNLQDEWVYYLRSLTLPQETNSWEEAQAFSAIRLFLSRARRQETTFKLSEENYPQIHEICKMLGGLPLGIELAASWLRVINLQAICEELKDDLSGLDSDFTDMNNRHKSLEATVEYSWQLLTDQEQQVLLHLSVFKGSFKREAAKAVANANLKVIAALVNKSLVNKTDAGMYFLHPVPQELLHKKFRAEVKTYNSVKDIHSNYFLSLTADLANDFGRENHKQVLKAYKDNLLNITAAWQWIVEQQDIASPK